MLRVTRHSGRWWKARSTPLSTCISPVEMVFSVGWLRLCFPCGCRSRSVFVVLICFVCARRDCARSGHITVHENNPAAVQLTINCSSVATSYVTNLDKFPEHVTQMSPQKNQLTRSKDLAPGDCEAVRRFPAYPSLSMFTSRRVCATMAGKGNAEKLSVV